MNLPAYPADITGKRVLVRADFDVGEDDARLKNLLPTLKQLIQSGSKIILMGHMGRPEGKVDPKLSLSEVSQKLSALLQLKVEFANDSVGNEAKSKSASLAQGKVLMLENLRFDSREESNDAEFAKLLSELGEVYVNEAFAASHRAHASIVGVAGLLPHYAGGHFIEEVNNLSRVFESKDGVVIIVGGAKKDKLTYLKDFESLADKILIGGRLPEYYEKDKVSVRTVGEGDKIVVADLIADKEDITINSVERFEAEIAKAKTLVLAGPMGRFEEEGHSQGTKRIFSAVAESGAFKVAGGGETERALSLFGLTSKFDWISSGGGAALEFLAKRTLPGIDALIH